jgi:hypothetical protein
MPRFQYKCPTCEGTVPAERVERRTPMSKGKGVGGRAPNAVIQPVLMCEADGEIMVRESYTPARREVRD